MAELYPQYFRFKYNGLLFVGCVATKRPMLTPNSDLGHRSGGVFKQVEMTLHLSSSPLSLTKDQVGMAEVPGGFRDQALADPPASPSTSLHTCLDHSP